MVYTSSKITISNHDLRRVAQGGRNWEGFGADPYLTGEAAYETILGMQQGGVQACAKHFINKYVRSVSFKPFITIKYVRHSEQEYKRMLEDSIVDDRPQRELYAHPFLRSIQAGVASIMCSYSKSSMFM